MNFGIIGSQGRMGKELQAWFEAQGHQITYRKDVEEEILKANPEGLIDFSKASALEETLILAHRFSCPLILGTTALQEEHWDLLRKASQELAVDVILSGWLVRQRKQPNCLQPEVGLGQRRDV